MNRLTTNQGVPIGNNQSSRTAGQHGPTLLEDYQLLEKLAHFDRERVPERVVHARGAGAHGVFKVANSMKRYTKAAFLQHAGQETPVFVRFSTVTYVEPSYTILDGAASVRQVIDKPNNFGQAGLVWNRYSEQEQAAVIKNLTNDLRAVSERTQLLAICNFYRADAALGHLLADSLNVDISAYVSPSKQP